MKCKRLLAGVFAVTVALTALTGCGKKKEATGDADTLRYWMPLNAAVSTMVTNYKDTPFAQEWMKKTNTKLEFVHPPQGQESEKFSIMIASNELTDIVEYGWPTAYAGGPDKAVQDGYIINLNDKLETNSPAYWKYLQENPDIDRLVKTDTGVRYAYPGIIGDKSLMTSAGLIVRKDWLDELSLSVPETIDEWEVVLKAFRDQKGATAPLSFPISYFSWNMFVGAYGVGNGMYLDGDTIKCGPLQPQFKEFLMKMNQWYQDGLLDRNIASLDQNTQAANILNGVSGATAGAVGGGIGKWMAAAPNETYNLVPAPYPVLEKGAKAQFGHITSPVNTYCIAITSKCKDIDKAMKLLDYGYTDEGRILFNFGVEGDSYEMIDGYPTYTEKITHSPDGVAMQSMLGLYCRAANGAIGTIQDPRYMEQYAGLPQQKDAVKLWSDTNALEHMIPTFNPSQEESNEYAKLITAVDSYNTEMISKFIMGIESFDKYDEYQAQLKQRGMERIVEIHQNAHNKFLQR